MKKTILTLLAAFTLLLPSMGMATTISYTDLWDMSNGTAIDDTSGALNYNASFKSDVRDMLGGSFAVIETGYTLFKDYMSPGLQGGSVQPGYTHYVEWHTSADVTLKSFALHVYNEGATRRAFSSFSLYSGDGLGNWSSIFDSGSVAFVQGFEEFSANIAPLTAQYFRLEVVQAPWTDPRAVGPRMVELDGFDTFLEQPTIPGYVAVPEPSTMLLLGLGIIGMVGIRRKQ